MDLVQLQARVSRRRSKPHRLCRSWYNQVMYKWCARYSGEMRGGRGAAAFFMWSNLRTLNIFEELTIQISEFLILFSFRERSKSAKHFPNHDCKPEIEREAPACTRRRLRSQTQRSLSLNFLNVLTAASRNGREEPAYIKDCDFNTDFPMRATKLPGNNLLEKKGASHIVTETEKVSDWA
jgi:hypothetical protein